MAERLKISGKGVNGRILGGLAAATENSRKIYAASQDAAFGSADAYREYVYGLLIGRQLGIISHTDNAIGRVSHEEREDFRGPKGFELLGENALRGVNFFPLEVTNADYYTEAFHPGEATEPNPLIPTWPEEMVVGFQHEGMVHFGLLNAMSISILASKASAVRVQPAMS